MKPFEIGLSFTGTVSAGAYTAGVLDFLIEALEEWEKQKKEEITQHSGDFSSWGTPWHNVNLTGISGASGGGVTCGLLLNTLGRSFKPVTYPVNNGEMTGNDLYDTWVEMLGSEQLLGTDDIKGNSISSLLNGDALKNIADTVLQPGRYLNTYKRGYINKELAAFVTLTNLRGIPYSLGFKGANETDLVYTRYTDYALFIKSENIPAAPTAGSFFLPGDKSHPAFAGSYSKLKAACLGTCAFPVGFRARPFSQETDTYLSRPGGGKSPLNKNELYEYMCSDGGILNTQPFELLHTYMTRSNKVAQNPRPPEKVERAIITIAPLETTEKAARTYSMGDGLLKVVPEVLKAIRGEAMFGAEEIALAFNEEVYSRFMIAPVRNPTPFGGNREKPAITGGTMGAFGAFLSRDFREHDFFLGRRNAQKFLRDYFVVPRSAISANPVFSQVYNGFDIEKIITKTNGIETLQIIPLCGSTKNELYFPVWPTKKGYDLEVLEKAIAARVGKIAIRATSSLNLNWFERQIACLLAGAVKNKTVGSIMGAVKNELKENNL